MFRDFPCQTMSGRSAQANQAAKATRAVLCMLSAVLLVGCGSQDERPATAGMSAQSLRSDFTPPDAASSANSIAAEQAASTVRSGTSEYRAAVSRIVDLHDQIRQGFAENNRWAVRPSLHRIGHTLRGMDNLIATSELTGDQRRSADLAVSELYNVFGEIDALMLGVEGITYDEACPQIDRNLQILCEVCALP